MPAPERNILGEGFKPLPFKISLGVQVGELVFLSGHAAMDDTGGVVGKGDAGAQTRRTIELMKGTLADAGGSLSDIVKATVFLRNSQQFHAFNDVWTEYFSDRPPARTTVECGFMHPDLLVEIDAIAIVGT